MTVMPYFFLIALCLFNALHATEHTILTQVPLPPIKDKLFEVSRTRAYFEKRWQQKKEGVQEILFSIFPTVLARIVEEYRTPNNGLWKTISVKGLIYKRGGEMVQSSREKLYIDIPFRYSPTDNENITLCELRNKDIVLACTKLLNQSTYIHWINDMHEPWKKQRLQEFLSHTLTYPLSIMSFDSQTIDVHCPFIDHFPLAIYFEQEEDTLTKVKSLPILQYSKYSVYAYSHAVDLACYEILQDHKKILPTTRKEDLHIVCTNCNKHIASPSKNCAYLLMNHPTIPDDSLLCNGKDRICRTFRALHVYLSVKTENSLETSKSHKRKEPNHEPSGPHKRLRIIIPTKKQT